MASYAVIGLERVGGIMIFDVTNPFHPAFVSHEISGTITVFEMTK